MTAHPYWFALLVGIVQVGLLALAFYAGKVSVPKPEPAPEPAPAEDSPLLAAARLLTEQAERTCRGGGEYKRHWCYARLLKQFPELPKRDLAYAIEVALRQE